MFSVPFATPNILPLEQTRKSMQKAKEMVYLKTPRLWCTSAIQGSSRVHLTGLTTNTEIVDFRGFNLFGGSRLKKPKNLQEPPRTSKDQGNKIGPKIAGATSLEARAGATGTGKSTSAVSHRLGGRSAQFLGNPRVATRWGKFLKKTEVFQSFRSTYRAYSVSIVSTIVYPIPFSHIHIIFSIRTRVSFRCWLG